MRERDRELKRRRHRRSKRLKKRPVEENLRTERPSGSKRAVKKVPPAPAESPTGGAATAAAPPAEPAPKKKAPAKKAPAKKAVPPAEVPEAPENSGEGGAGPEEPQGA